MYTTLKITNWSGVEETLHVTGFTHKPGSFIAFHQRDLDTGAIRMKDNGRPHLDLFWLVSPEPGVATIKKAEVYSPSGALVDTLMGQPMTEAKQPRAKSPAKAKA